MRQPDKPIIIFLTDSWTNVDDRIRSGQEPGGTPSVAGIWRECVGQGLEVHVFILTKLTPGWRPQTVELGGVTFHWIAEPFEQLTNVMRNHGLVGFFKPLWLIWQLQMLWRIVRSGVQPNVVYCMRSTFAIAGWLWSRFTGALFVQRHYGTWLYYCWFEKKSWINRLSWLGTLLSMRIPCDLLIMTNDGTNGDRIAEWAGCPMARFRFWLNGVNISREDHLEACEAKRALGLAPNDPVLVQVGRLDTWKRQDRLIDAMPAVLKMFPRARLILVGEGPSRSNLEQRIQRLDIQPAVLLAGSIGHSKVKKYLRACDLYVQGQDLSNLSNTLLEAMAAGCCIITRSAGGTDSIIHHRENGILLNPGEATDFAEAIVDLLKNDEERARLGQNARQFAVENFLSWDARLRMEVQEILGMIDSSVFSPNRHSRL
ncbi:MAG: glycosyltransferase family 4 protein [Chloroflexota bacterium]